MASVCRTKTPVNQQNKSKDNEKNVKKNKYKKDVHQIDDESDSFEKKEPENDEKVHLIKPIIETYLNGVQTDFELDWGSGASTSSKL